MVFGVGPERVEHDRSGDGAVRRRGQHEPGVVIDPHQDLRVGAIRETPVGEVGLPTLVGQLGFETDVGRLRSLLRLGDHQSGIDEAATDRRHRHGDAPPVGEVPRDRVRASVESLVGQLGAKVHDPLDHLR